MTLSDTKDLATVVAAAVAVFTLVKGFIEYRSQGRQKRAEQFLELRKRLKDNPSFKNICALIEIDDPPLATVPFREKRDFLGFFEEVALFTNSGLLPQAVAHYMFGYYAIRCWDSQYFWTDVNRDGIYWSLFRDFVERMKRVESGFAFKPAEFRF